MSTKFFTNYGHFNPYVIMLMSEHKYTKLNLPFEEANRKHPSKTITLEAGFVLYSQDKPFTVEDIAEVKEKNFPYQWGFGPCVEMIPYGKIKFLKLETINI